MGAPIIEVKGISKKYRIGHRENYLSLRDSLVNIIKKPLNLLKGSSDTGESNDEFWALKDVSFNVEQGEIVGIIGKNGAGKTTMLKILSRITYPTKGEIHIRGRVASLLEVGTGFHPELTGRENIYFNGSILGMKKREIDKKFDEIVAFSEIEKFIDTPAKRYSSGMYLRLAFAVAAHLDPEILVIDEVLAVGDASFQKKCLGKMGDVAKEGRTVLFVSHNMAAVSQLCKIGILLKKGQIAKIDNVDNVISHYVSINSSTQSFVDLQNFPSRSGNGLATFLWAKICNSAGKGCREFVMGEDIHIKFSFKVHEHYQNKNIRLSVIVRRADGLPLCTMDDLDSGFQIEKAGSIEEISVIIKDIRFYPDTYYITFWIGNINAHDPLDHVEDCLSFEITGGGRMTSRRLTRIVGVFFLTPEWKRIVT